MPHEIGRIQPDEQNPADRPWRVYVLDPQEFRRYGIADDTDVPKLFRGFLTTLEALYGIPNSAIRIELGAELMVEEIPRIEPLCVCLRHIGECWVPQPCPWCDGKGYFPTGTANHER